MLLESDKNVRGQSLLKELFGEQSMLFLKAYSDPRLQMLFDRVMGYTGLSTFFFFCFATNFDGTSWACSVFFLAHLKYLISFNVR